MSNLKKNIYNAWNRERNCLPGSKILPFIFLRVGTIRIEQKIPYASF
jgi:hypothetical protein